MSWGKKNEVNVPIYLNSPLNTNEADWIGVNTYVDNIKSAIEQGAKMIAITSNFGTGKSSIIQLLENSINSSSKGKYKFCNINLWSHINKIDFLELHKTFLYQLVSQINPNRGSYISKRLSTNYGLLKFGASSTFNSILSFLAIIAAIASFFLSNSAGILDPIWKNLKIDANQLSISFLAFAVLVGTLIIIRDGIIFSSKNSEGNRKIEESEIIDLYQTTVISRGIRKHYIVVIEDLDRTNNAAALDFIKELRKYYIPEYKSWFQKIFNNRISFIVNIKPEVLLHADASSYSQSTAAFSKIFDYTVDLRTIHIDNYDSILEGLIIQKCDELLKLGLTTKDSNNVDNIPGMQWIIRGKELSIREIKERLNSSLLLFKSLTERFGGKTKISFEKCAVVAYLSQAYAVDFYKMDYLTFDKLIDEYLTSKTFDFKHHGVLSIDYCKELELLLENKLIDIDYRKYFYNYPKNSIIYTADEIKVRDVILYDESIQKNEQFENIVREVTLSNKKVITDAYNKRKKLNLTFPSGIIESETLYTIAVDYDLSNTIDTIRKSLSGREESTSKDLDIINRILNYDRTRKVYSESIINKFCSSWISTFTPSGIEQIRIMICKNFTNEIEWYKLLYMEPMNLITENEINLINNLDKIISLLNFDSITSEIVIIIHKKILEKTQLDLDMNRSIYEKFYLDLIEYTIPSVYVPTVLEYMRKMLTIIPHFETEVYEYLMVNKDLINEYIYLINCSSSSLTQQTFNYIIELNLYEGLSLNPCQQLLQNELYYEYLHNALLIIPNEIDFSNKNIMEIIYNKNVELFTNYNVKWIVLREQIVLSKLFVEYNYMFSSPFPLINSVEMGLIDTIENVINLIDIAQLDESNIQTVVSYFNSKFRRSNDAFLIFSFIASFESQTLAKATFYKLDINQVKYSQMSGKKKKSFRALYQSILDLRESNGILTFMDFTNDLDPVLEIIIQPSLNNIGHEDLREKYVKLLTKLDSSNNITIKNLVTMPCPYALTESIEDKLYKKQYFQLYVLSRTLRLGKFVIEHDKIEALWVEYVNIFNSESLWQDSKYEVNANKLDKVQTLMKSNNYFLELIIENNSYVGFLLPSRLSLSKVNQTIESLNNILEYGKNTAIQYFRMIEGFHSKSSATHFLDLLSVEPDFVSDAEIYSNVYDKLIDPSLKSRLTRLHHKVKG